MYMYMYNSQETGNTNEKYTKYQNREKGISMYNMYMYTNTRTDNVLNGCNTLVGSYIQLALQILNIPTT